MGASGFSWAIGLFLAFIGYALFYTGLQNLRTSGNGPTLTESFGLPTPGPKGVAQGTKPGSGGSDAPWWEGLNGVPKSGGSGSK